jgi:hypothetical protein
MAACLLCGCDDSQHTPRFVDSVRPCEAQVLLQPPTTLLPEGRTEPCGCVGLEIDDEEATE